MTRDILNYGSYMAMSGSIKWNNTHLVIIYGSKKSDLFESYIIYNYNQMLIEAIVERSIIFN